MLQTNQYKVQQAKKNLSRREKIHLHLKLLILLNLMQRLTNNLREFYD
jgi:hypothetical protein